MTFRISAFGLLSAFGFKSGWSRPPNTRRVFPCDLSSRHHPPSCYTIRMASALKELPPLILASASPRRAELLRQLGIKFQVLASDVPEIHNEQLTANEIAQVNAYRKARAIAK